jgi:hypothetical protein
MVHGEIRLGNEPDFMHFADANSVKIWKNMDAKPKL